MHTDNTGAFLRNILPLKRAFTLEELKKLAEAGLQDNKGQRIRLPVMEYLYRKLIVQSKDWEGLIEPVTTREGPWQLALAVSAVLEKRVSEVGAELEMPGMR